jgi:prolyl-tRNA synthetase
MTEIARKELRSYKQLPQIWYQIQAKFRDEPRPKSGLLRVRQFIMKDSYSFDLDAAGLDASYQKHYDTYCRIFDRCGLQYVAVEAHSGAMGGSQSHEFTVYSDAGEDFIVSCPNCKYAATRQGKGKEFPVLVFLRGDHTLNEAKLSSALSGAQFRPMQPEEIQEVFGAPAGFLGPIGSEQRQYRGVSAKVFVDRALLGRKNLVAGANKEDYHLRNVTPQRDFDVAEEGWVDLRSAEAGEGCPNCGTPLKVAKAVEIGHIFKLGYKYSESMGARVLDQNGKEVAPIMGSYGIGIERILTAAIEQNHDDDGFWLPVSIAPFEIVVTPTNTADKKLVETAEQITRELEAAGFDVLLDDRDERPGVKFKDADLVGIPFRVTVGKKVTNGVVEVVRRSTREIQDANIRDITSYFQKILRPAHS